MFKFLKKLIYKNDKSNGIQYKDIETGINKDFYVDSKIDKPFQPKKLAPSVSLERNVQYISSVFNNCIDLKVREFNIAGNPKAKASLIYIANLTPQDLIENTIINKLAEVPLHSFYPFDSIEYCQKLMGINENDIYTDIYDVLSSIMNGETVLFIDNINKALPINMKSPPGRSVETPQAESVIRGPREGFIESSATNMGLLRKKIKSPHLKMEGIVIGKETKTNIVISYMDNIANNKIVEEVKERLKKIDIDSVLAASYIEEYIEDNPFSLFPTMFVTEKPDVIAGKILEGRIAIFVDGTPSVLTAPTLFTEFFMSPDDYYLRFSVAVMSRWVRIIAFFMSITLPATYVSLVTFHQELIPTQLLVTIIKSRANLPFPAVFEAFFMLFTYMVLQEADVRMPKSMGQAVSVVGGLVLGQAAISAGIVSAPMIIVIAFSAVCSLALPTPELQVSLSYIRLGLLILSGISGALGLTCGMIVLLMHIISLRSFGVPYLAPLAPLKPEEFGDTIVASPHWMLKKRSKTITWKDSVRRRGREEISNPITEEQKEADNSLKKGG